MGIQIEFNKGRVPVKVWTRNIEPEAIRQLLNVASLPVVHGHVAAMPDVHAGIGATVGSVIPTRKAIIPAAVGVDIGCGMNAVRTSLSAGQLPDKLRSLRMGIEEMVPLGFNMHPASRMRGSALLSEGSGLFDEYVEAVDWAQDYALLNRQRLLAAVIEVLKRQLPTFSLEAEAINCHHNYVARETHFGEALFITRKGAISARAGELGIIPGSMGAKSYIVRGLGNAQSFCSCSHGAGRRMSRSAAKHRFSRFDLEAQTAGIECRKDGGVIDEIPGAYKDIDQVMDDQRDLVEVVHTLKQVLCVKG